MSLYDILKPVFESETMKSAIRQAGLVRQAHLAAALRKEEPSAEFALRGIKAQHAFMEALCTAFVEQKVPDDVCDALGYHSFMFFGVNPRIFEIAMVVAAGEGPDAIERVLEENRQADVDSIVRGEDNPLDTLRWLQHSGTGFASYLAGFAK